MVARRTLPTAFFIPNMRDRGRLSGMHESSSCREWKTSEELQLIDYTHGLQKSIMQYLVANLILALQACHFQQLFRSSPNKAIVISGSARTIYVVLHLANQVTILAGPNFRSGRRVSCRSALVNIDLCVLY